MEPSLNIKWCKLIPEGTNTDQVILGDHYYKDKSVESWTPGPYLTISN